VMCEACLPPASPPICAMDARGYRICTDGAS
jgi:hypothetical protein